MRKGIFYNTIPLTEDEVRRRLMRIDRKRSSRYYKEERKSYFLIFFIFLILGIVGLMRATTLG